MRRRRPSLAANPVLVGAVTTLVVVTAVFLAYNANQGLPFVPTFQLKVEVPNASRLVVGNDVREGGERIGQVTEIDPVKLPDGKLGAQLTVKIDRGATPLPDDSSIIIRPRSTLGLKYVDLVRGRSDRELAENGVLVARAGAIPPELDELFGMFDPPTRRDSRENLTTFGSALAGRGADLNRTLAALPQLFGDLPPVMRVLSDPDTRLRAFFRELADAARITVPVATALSQGFTYGADTFEALSRDPQALEDTIAESPPTLDVALRSLPAQRPFLHELAAISGDVRGVAREARLSAPLLVRALDAGTAVLPETPPFNDRLRKTFAAFDDLARSPTTNLTLAGLQSTTATLDPTLKFLGPQITVCNYWNYWWTYLSDHLAERVPSGTIERIEAKTAPGAIASFGATRPANNDGDPITGAVLGDPVNLHAQYHGRAVDEQGNADCESGQRGYPKRLAEGAPAGLDIAVDPRTPGLQGPTFTGKPKVPAGQTFSAEPTGLAPKVVP
jgi:ABC-type transporter Mla subunit MlaD